MGMEEVTDNHKLYKKVFLKSLLFYRFLRIFVHTFCMYCFPRGKQARQFLFLPPCRTEKRVKHKIISPTKKQKKMKKKNHLLILMSLVFIMAASCTKEAMTSAKNPVFCVTESGCITAEDFRKADEYLQSLSSLDEIEHDIGSRDPYINDIGETFVPAIILSRVYLGDLPINFSDDDEEAGDDNDEPTRLYDTVVVSKVGPFLETKWTQWSPFNNFLNNKDIPAGCVAIATAQILAHNEVATKDSFDGHPYDWDLMKTVYNYRNIGGAGEPEAQELVSAFSKEVGKRENCRIRYKEGSSSGYADGAKRTFKNYGYKDVRKYLGFGKKKQEKVIAQLTYGLPVYIDGLDKSWSGHAWVIDGFFVRNIYYASTGKLKEQERMFHCNWGWHGASDGYYSQGVFNTEDRIDEDETDTATSEYSHNYTWCYRPITYSL